VSKEIGVELSSYHGGSLNGKDIKKVMNNASHIFDQFAAIFKEGKREDCLLADANIDLMCLHFWEVYVLWDGTFLLARIINPTDEDAEAYQTFILAAVSGSKFLQCPITPKIHTMLRHVQWQIKNIPGCQESSFGTQAWCGHAPCKSGRWRFVGDKGFRGKGFAYFKYSL
jgi:hypothetical protein